VNALNSADEIVLSADTIGFIFKEIILSLLFLNDVESREPKPLLIY
jgi:hypothetical protein